MSIKPKKSGLFLLFLCGLFLLNLWFLVQGKINPSNQLTQITLVKKQTKQTNKLWTPPVEQTISRLTSPETLYTLTNPFETPLHVTVYLANKERLQRAYSYVNTELRVYGGEKKENRFIPLTLEKNYASFVVLKGTYEVVLEKGVFYTVDATSVRFPDYAISFEQK